MTPVDHRSFAAWFRRIRPVLLWDGLPSSVLIVFGIISLDGFGGDPPAGLLAQPWFVSLTSFTCYVQWSMLLSGALGLLLAVGLCLRRWVVWAVN